MNSAEHVIACGKTNDRQGAVLKIAYVLNTYPQPSHSFIRREVKALERQGVEVMRFAMRRPTMALVDPQDVAEEAQTEYVLETGAVGLLRSLAGMLVRRPRKLYAAVRLAIQAGRRSEAGVLRHLIYLAEAAHVTVACKANGAGHIHAHFGTNSTTVAMLCQALGGPGFSFTVHGPEEFDAPRALSLSQKISRARFTVAISQFGRSQLCRWAPLGKWASLNVVHCGIEKTRFEAVAALPTGALRLVSVGRFHEQKGQMVLIDAMARLRDSQPDIHLTLVGDGELRPALEWAIAERQLGDRITLAGWLSEAGVNEVLAQSHVMVMPSFAEGLPMVIMEAMAAARPVISTYVAGIPELVQSGKTGWLVPAGDADALSTAIVKAAESTPAELAEMGAAGRSRALMRHDVDAEAARLKQYFQAAIRTS